MYLGCCTYIGGVTPPQQGNCADWLAYHKSLAAQFGKAKANEIWLFWWNKQSNWSSNKNWCKYDTEFSNYLKNQGIDVGNIFSDVINTGVNIVDGAASGLSLTAKLLKIAIPAAAVYIAGKYLKIW